MMAVVVGKSLRKFGRYLFLLDSACSPSATVFNFSTTAKEIWENDHKTITSTLGGSYTAPCSANFEFFGPHDYDEDLPMSILSWYRMIELGCSITDVENGKYIRFSNIPVILHVQWVDGVLAD